MNAQNAPTEPITKARRATNATTNRMPCVHGGQGRTNEEASKSAGHFVVGILVLIGFFCVVAFVRLWR
jgi:hypothetical protein